MIHKLITWLTPARVLRLIIYFIICILIVQFFGWTALSKIAVFVILLFTISGSVIYAVAYLLDRYEDWRDSYLAMNKTLYVAMDGTDILIFYDLNGRTPIFSGTLKECQEFVKTNDFLD